METRKLLAVITFTLLSINQFFAQNVNIPDANFKSYLINNSSVNTNGDSEIQLSEANSFYGSINCANQNISDLTGIEAFVNIYSLNCKNNQITNLNLINNVNLIMVFCFNNQIQNINVSNSPQLIVLNAYSNQIGSLNINNNTNLRYLNCSGNQITSLDTSNNTSLQYLLCQTNQITSLSLLNNSSLKALTCSGNQLTTLDITTNSDLEYFDASFNQLTELNLSNNSNLKSLRCYSNNLNKLNIKNGNNTNINNNLYNIGGNPNLTCVQVDNVSYSNTNWTAKDPQTSYSTNCNACIVNIPDTNFKSYLVNNGAINTNGDSEIQCNEATNYFGAINCPNLNISDLTGIEAFVNIYSLNCRNNSITNLNLINNTNLTTVFCFNNQIQNIDVSGSPQLTLLNCYNNQISNLNLVNNTNLSYVNCSGNQINILDVSNSTALQNLLCQTNQIANLNVSNNSALKALNCSNNQLTTLNVSNNLNLEDLVCSFNQIKDLDLSNNTNLRSLRSYSNNLKNLNLKNGNYTNINNNLFNIAGNPNLTCVQVDNVNYSTINWTAKDSQTTYSNFCTYVPLVNPNVTLYPNPAQNVLKLKVSNLKIYKAEIFNISGRLSMDVREVNESLDISELEKGIYYVKLYSDKKIIKKEFIKE